MICFLLSDFNPIQLFGKTREVTAKSHTPTHRRLSLGRATANDTGISHSLFILLGIPGLEDQHPVASLLFFISYLVALLGNSLLIFIIITERSLHEPMYLFLCMLAVTDLILSTTTVPKALAIFWFHAGAMSLDGCVTQIFVIHATFITESGIVLAMAFDWYVAICDPLHYTAVLSHAVIIKIGLAVGLRSFCVILPDVFLVKRLPFCCSNLLPHTYCEHIAVAKFACADIHVSVWYGLSVLLSTVVLNALLFLVSYSVILVIFMFYLPGIFTIITQWFGHHVLLHTHILLPNGCMLAPPVLNPIIYGIKTRQIQECVLSTLSSQWK
ncbi:olfactory receptor 52B4-like [Carlito syrichta]|uniref:Olfactory receptor 52B4-like n=1 Tax=Carlito syrichta TaxID=1868482 RepID=A0A3Q0DL42_CARSF|nr:olfactory receptor 52B4-like [Carlito syrichta]